MLESNEKKELRKTVGKTKIDRIRNQQFRESCGIQTINEWVERRRREWDQQVTRMNAERLVKISMDNILESPCECGIEPPGPISDGVS